MIPAPINTYKSPDYLRRFAAEAAAVPQLLTAAAEQFFIVPVERLYPLFTRPLPPARATAHTCLYLTSGTATMHIGAETCTVRPHEVLLVRAGQVYSFQPGDQNTGFLCHFHNEVLIGNTGSADALNTFGFLHYWGAPIIGLDAQTAGFVEALLRRLLVEYAAHGLHRPGLVRAYLLALLHELNQSGAAAAPPEPTTAAAITTRFKQLVATSLASLTRVSDYADRLNITPNHLAKCVRAVTGKAPARWLEETQVLEAKVLLSQSGWPVAEVAAAVGVADASYFSRLFKKHTGTSPLVYRKKLKES